MRCGRWRVRGGGWRDAADGGVGGEVEEQGADVAPGEGATEFGQGAAALDEVHPQCVGYSVLPEDVSVDGSDSPSVIPDSLFQ